MDLPNNSFFQYPSDYAPDKNKNFIWILLAGWIVFLIGGLAFALSPDPRFSGIGSNIFLGLFIITFITFVVLSCLMSNGDVHANEMNKIIEFKTDAIKYKKLEDEFKIKLNNIYKDDTGWPWSPPIKT